MESRSSGHDEKHDKRSEAPFTPSPVAVGTPVLTPEPRPSLESMRSPHKPSRLLLTNAVLGIWLMISTGAWPHAEATRANTWVVGVLLTVFGLAALRSAGARAFCGMLALWLLVSCSFMVPRTELTFWNNLLVGFGALIVTFLGGATERAGSARTHE